jgi:hypothetical protein
MRSVLSRLANLEAAVAQLMPQDQPYSIQEAVPLSDYAGGTIALSGSSPVQLYAGASGAYPFVLTYTPTRDAWWWMVGNVLVENVVASIDNSAGIYLSPNDADGRNELLFQTGVAANSPQISFPIVGQFKLSADVAYTASLMFNNSGASGQAYPQLQQYTNLQAFAIPRP